ncbi:MAG: TetR/AcrR family transcriptional regulator C-terminal domain-containing protein [Pseudomonadota bacterium]
MLAKPRSAGIVLEKFIKAYANYLAAPENIILTIEISSEAVRKPDIGELFVANREELVTALTSVLQRGVEAGEFRKDLKPNEASQLIIELIDASAYRSVLSDIAMRKILGGLKDFIFAAVGAT